MWQMRWPSRGYFITPARRGAEDAGGAEKGSWISLRDLGAAACRHSPASRRGYTPRMTWLTASSVALIGGALVAAQAATAYQPCATRVPGEQDRVSYLGGSGPSPARSLSSLIDLSQVIVVGRLDSQVCRVDTSIVPMVNSKFTVVVESALRGSAPRATLSMLVRGTGRTVTSEGRLFHTELDDNFEPPKVGDRVLLFLKPDGVERDVFAGAGWGGQGMFRVNDDGTIRSPWRGLVRHGQEQENVHGQLDGKKTADVLADVTRLIGR